MSKAVMISIKPKWCKRIASGEKTIEVRKTRPWIETPFRCYIYCTQDGKENFICRGGEDFPFIEGNGSVIGEFTCDSVTVHIPGYKTGIRSYWALLDGSCLKMNELDEYGNLKHLYGWHISDLRIYDEPKELSEFRCRTRMWYGYSYQAKGRPPQSWCYVEELQDADRAD